MRHIIVTVISMLLLLSGAGVAAGSVGGDNYIWVSHDVMGNYTKSGYFHQDEYFTKIISTNSTENKNSFNLSFGNDIIRFTQSSALYAELGLNTGTDAANVFFGGGYHFQDRSERWLILVGSRYYLPLKRLVNEAQLLYSILPPLVLNLSYDDYSCAVYAGVGLKFY